MKQSLRHTKLPSACSVEAEWRPLPGFSGRYVSEYGDIVSDKIHRALRGYVDADGYIAYNMRNDEGKNVRITAHRAVAIAFLDRPNEGMTQVRHLNGCRMFNHYTNLSWGTAKENVSDSLRHETNRSVGGSNPKAKLTEDQVIKLRRDYRDMKNRLNDLTPGGMAREYGIHIATLSRIAKGKLWKHVPLAE